MIRIREPKTAHRDIGLENVGFKPDHIIDDLGEIPEIIRKENE